MNNNTSLSEKIISRLNAGENFESISNTLRADEKLKAQAISDWWEFMEAQKLDIKPSKSAFKNTLNQAILLSNTKNTDDEVTGWGNFFRSFHFKTFGLISFSLLFVIGISQDFIGNFVGTEIKDSQKNNPAEQATKMAVKKEIKSLAFNSEIASFSHVLEGIESSGKPTIILENLDLDDQFVKDLEIEFNEDMDDFYKTQKSLESLYKETLFENSNQKDISKLYKKTNSSILAKDRRTTYL